MPMDGIQSTTVAAAGTGREVSLAPMFFGYVLCVHHNKLKRYRAHTRKGESGFVLGL